MSLILSDDFMKHVAKEIGCELKILRQAIGSYEPSKNPVAPKKKELPKNTSKEVKLDTHTCDRVKNGYVVPCGAVARNKMIIDGEEQWFCGPPSGNSGCYRIMIRREKKKVPEVSKKVEPKKKKAAPKKAVSSKSAPAGSKGKLVKKVTRKKQLRLKETKLADGTSIFYDFKTRIVFDSKTEEAYAHLSKGKELEELSDDNIRFLEASNLSFRIDEAESSSEEEVEESSDEESEEESNVPEKEESSDEEPEEEAFEEESSDEESEEDAFEDESSGDEEYDIEDN